MNGIKLKLQDMGIRVYEYDEMGSMLCDGFEELGAGAYGSCIKIVDPDTHQEIVIKIFTNTGAFYYEAVTLHALQMRGV